jgi:glycine betaine/proline transport system ATP-binding protein
VNRHVLSLEGVHVVYGDDQSGARARLSRGASREELRAAGYVVAVEAATLGVRSGEICVLMGQSGSGKSSLLRCMNGLALVTCGQVLVRDGDHQVDVAACDGRRLRDLRQRRIAMVFQHFALMPWRTVRDNAAFGLEVQGVPHEERARRAQDVLALVGLSDWAGAYPHELSGGMQQRVGLARAYVTDADILLMDEPFSALDPLTRLRLQDELLALQRKVPRTIVFVTHDVTEALKIGSRVAILDAGRIVQVGTPEDIALRPATSYVREFAAGLNPLMVLRAASVMCPVTPHPGMPLLIDGFRIALDAEGRPGAAVATVAAGALLRDVVAARVATDKPLVVVDDQGRAAGFIDEHQIVRALVRDPAPDEVSVVGSHTP